MVFSGGGVTMEAPNDAERTFISGGRVDFNTDQTLESVELSENGTLGGSAVVTVPSFVWTGGFQDTPNSGFSNNEPGTGATVITGSLTMDRPDGNPSPTANNPVKNLNRLLRIEPGATAVLRGNNDVNSRGYLNLAGGSHLSGRLENEGTLSIEQDQDIFGGVRGIANTGTITKVAGAGGGDTFIDPALDNDGTLETEQGRVLIRGNGLNTHTGAFDIAGGATLHFNGGNHRITGASGIRHQAGDQRRCHGGLQRRRCDHGGAERRREDVHLGWPGRLQHRSDAGVGRAV